MLALLGVVTPGSRLPAVAIGNLLGGLVTFAIAARLVSPPMPSDRVLNPVAIGVALLLSAQIISGGLVSAAQAGLACTDIRQCIEQSSAGGWDWAALNPWREPAFAVGTPHVEGALAQLLHRLVSLAVAPALACLGVLAVQKGRHRDGLAVLLLVVCVVVLGLVSGSTGLPLMPVLLHNLATALLFAAVVRLT
jgi:heme A synthase